MKIYVENGEVFFDYSDVNMSTRVDSPDFIRASKIRKFLLATRCNWIETAVQQVVKMQYEPYSWASEYGQTRQYESYLKDCSLFAKVADIAISKDFEELLVTTARHCKELYELEEAKELERKAKEKWRRLCENGCGCCDNKSRWNDDIVCSASGDLLNEKFLPGIVNGCHTLFNRVAFPSENCPYKVSENGG